MKLRDWNKVKLESIFDKCKKCGCTSFECRHCNNNQFYRHIDNKTKMKKNLKIIRLHRSGFLYYYIFFFKNSN